jgi:hypothetical protein
VPAKDAYHNAVRNALLKDGWTITHDPYTLSFGQRDVFVDLGAERPIAAEREGRRIAIEIKSFLGPSDMRELEIAVGQYVFYRSLLTRFEPDRKLFLAVTDVVFAGVFSEAIARPVVEDAGIALVVFNAAQEVIVKWTL